jgi:hypothetical protein
VGHQAVDAALPNGISRANIDQAVRLLDEGRRLWASPRLLHGDWLQEHILV